ncbi:MAG: nucleotidyltransferase [Candidatus Scalinduaceae bacterium]
MSVSDRFARLLDNLKLTKDQNGDGITKHGGIRTCLNKYYYNIYSGTANSMLIGSWGKKTRIRPPRDIDLLFILPVSVYYRFESRPGNKQSQLLQEVKQVLQATYSTTRMRGDGQVIVVQFQSQSVEVVPAFLLTSGQYWICDTHKGGIYKTSDPKAEINRVQISNNATSGNTRDLIRMLKCWQSYCNVPIKSFYLELLSIDFLQSWSYRGKSTVYYDWMTRDFFSYLTRKVQNYFFVPGTNELINVGSEWKSKAETAYSRAVKACHYEGNNMYVYAGIEWQKIFGTYIPA